MILTREFVEIEGNLYEVIRHIKESSNPIVDTWKEHLRADKVFRKDGRLFFCRYVDEAVVEEFIPHEPKSEITPETDEQV
jgi:hypothetical protein